MATSKKVDDNMDMLLQHLDSQLKDATKQLGELGAKLAQQQQVNAQLQQALADITGLVLTLAKAIGRLMP